MALSKTFVLLMTSCLVGFVMGEVVNFQTCPDAEDGTPANKKCQIDQLRISPCAEAAENKPCKVKRGRSASIEFDFTVGEVVENATSRAYWANELTDMPLVGMDTDSCSFTTCPIQQDVRQTFSQSLPLHKKFPVRTYDVKWKLWSANENVNCCFIFKIKLVK